MLVKVRGEMAFMPSVTAVLLDNRAMDRWTDCSVVSPEEGGNGGYACSYCSTVSSQSYGCRD